MKRRATNEVTATAAATVCHREQKQHPAKRNRNNNNYGCNYNSCVYVTLKPRMLDEIRLAHTTIVTFTLDDRRLILTRNGLSVSMISLATYVCMNNVSFRRCLCCLCLHCLLDFFFPRYLLCCSRCTQNRNENLFVRSRRAMKKLNSE